MVQMLGGSQVAKSYDFHQFSLITSFFIAAIFTNSPIFLPLIRLVIIISFLTVISVLETFLIFCNNRYFRPMAFLKRNIICV